MKKGKIFNVNYQKIHFALFADIPIYLPNNPERDPIPAHARTPTKRAYRRNGTI